MSTCRQCCNKKSTPMIGWEMGAMKNLVKGRVVDPQVHILVPLATNSGGKHK